MRKALLVLALLLFGASAFSQEYHHSVEISTGPPCILGLMYPPGSPDNGLTMEGQQQGIGYHAWAPMNLSLAYNYQINKHWEVSALLTHCGYIYSKYQYPEKGEGPNGMEYDWKATPENLGLRYDSRGFYLTGLARYYWYTKKASYQWYSAVGASVVNSSSIPIWPVLTPIGIRFGARHWYGRAELTVGVPATLLLVGVGRRF